MKNIAVVGMSPKPERPSHYVSLYMSQNGYDIIPVNPGHSKILNRTSYSSILDIEQPIDIVNVFRPSKEAPLIAKQTVKIRAKALWLQYGIQNQEAEER